jgi:hypothetical protein
MFLAAILAPPIFAKRLKLMTPYEKNSDKPLYNSVALAILLCAFIVSTPRKFEGSLSYPERAVAYMKANEIQGRMFHDWAWGGYLIWHTPELKVFIDGRGEPYGPTGVFKDYAAAISVRNPQSVLDKYKVEYVLIPADSSLSNFLKNSPAWTVIYSDETSALFHLSPRY